jgi:flagellar biogenesis protein FliO
MEQEENPKTTGLLSSEKDNEKITILDWLAPLVVVLLLVIFGAWFCSSR